MASRAAEALALRDGDQDRLLSLTRSSSVRAGLAQRARIVLLAADGLSNTAIAARVGVSRPTVIGWRGRYEQRGLKGLADEPRSGRPRRVNHRAVVAATLAPPPKKLGVTHWSSRLLAARLGIGNATVARAWRNYGIQPWRAETFKFSTDPELVAKVTDVVGLYLAPPENAVVLCVDEKSRAPRGADEAVRDERTPRVIEVGRSWRLIDPRVRGEIGSSLDNVGAGRNCQTARAR